MNDLVVISILETTSLTDPELINRHATRFRLIGAALGGKIEWLIQFMEGKGAWLTFSICDDF